MSLDEWKVWQDFTAKYGRLSPQIRASHERARIAVYLHHGLVGSGHYGKNAEPARMSDFCPWLETPIDLQSAMREWT